MNYFGSIGWKGLAFLFVLGSNESKDLRQFGQGLFASIH